MPLGPNDHQLAAFWPWLLLERLGGSVCRPQEVGASPQPDWGGGGLGSAEQGKFGAVGVLWWQSSFLRGNSDCVPGRGGQAPLPAMTQEE